MVKLKAGVVAVEGVAQPPAGKLGKRQRSLAADWRGAVQPPASLLASAPSQSGQPAAR